VDSIMGHIRWGVKYLSVPLFPHESRAMFAMSKKLLEERMKARSANKDLIYHLVSIRPLIIWVF
jgi:hypothetical protein